MFRSALASLVLIAGLLLAPAIVPVAVNAATVEINVGSILNGGRGITCGQGERMLRFRGYRDIRRVDCAGRFLVYRAWRGAGRYEIAVRARDGRVVDKRRLRPW
jgi:hypothetical protein